MRIPHDTLVLVTDGRKMLLFRNEGDADYPRLEAIGKAEDDNPPNRAIKSDKAGRMSFRRRRSAYQECDFHRQEEARFARDAASVLRRKAERGELDRLLVVADPRTLGELRQHYGKVVAGRLIGEVDKDLVRHPVGEIERLLCELPAPRNYLWEAPSR